MRAAFRGEILAEASIKSSAFGNQQIYGEAVLVRLSRSPHTTALKKEGIPSLSFGCSATSSSQP